MLLGYPDGTLSRRWSCAVTSRASSGAYAPTSS